MKCNIRRAGTPSIYNTTAAITICLQRAYLKSSFFSFRVLTAYHLLYLSAQVSECSTHYCLSSNLDVSPPRIMTLFLISLPHRGCNRTTISLFRSTDRSPLHSSLNRARNISKNGRNIETACLRFPKLVTASMGLHTCPSSCVPRYIYANLVPSSLANSGFDLQSAALSISVPSLEKLKFFRK